MASRPGVASLLLLLGLTGNAWSATVLNVLADLYPPFLVRAGNGLSGPYADAFRFLLKKKGIEVNYRIVPAKRAFLELGGQSNSCALAVNFDQGQSEILNFVGVVAPITLMVYVSPGNKLQIHDLATMRKYRVGGMNIAEVRDSLGSAGVTFTPVERSALGFLMLQAGRFDSFVSDQAPLPSSPPAQKTFELAEVDRWVVCNGQLPGPVINRIRSVLHQSIFSAETQPIWQSYGMLAYYRQMQSLLRKASQ